MRGRSLLFPALLLLAIPAVPPAAAADLPLPSPVARAVADPCLDVTSVFEDPKTVLVIASHCTVVATVSVQHDEQGRLVVRVILDFAGVVVTIVVSYAEWYIAECATEPNHLLPTLGPVREWYAACWDHDWMK